MILLAVDVGNSAVKTALFRDARPIRRGRPDRVAVSSVNPPLLRDWMPRLKAHGVPVHLAGRDFRVPMATLCRGAGTDRLLGAYAAWLRCRGPVLVVDAGTAVTLNLVDARGRFRGGAILPGPGLMLRSLSGGTARLPSIRPGEAPFPAPDTRGAMRAGVAMACRGAMREAMREAGGRPRVFLTGGGRGLLRGISPGITEAPFLVLEGLAASAPP